MRIAMFTMCVLLCGITWAGPTTKPADKPAAPPAKPDPAAGAPDEQFIVSKMRIQDFKPRNYLFAETTTTIAQIGPVVMEIIPKLEQAIKDGKVEVKGPAVFVFQGATADVNKPFTLQVGFLVADDTKDVGEFKVRQLDQFHCATVLFSGAVANVTQAYQQLYTDLFAAGLKPTGESREYYLYWESPESPNNVQLIQVGVE